MDNWFVLPPHERVEAVASDLVKNQLVPATQARDATHIAYAACYGVALLASLNFKHIVNSALVPRIEARLADEWGLPLKIATPEVIMELEGFDD